MACFISLNQSRFRPSDVLLQPGQERDGAARHLRKPDRRSGSSGSSQTQGPGRCRRRHAAQSPAAVIRRR